MPIAFIDSIRSHSIIFIEAAQREAVVHLLFDFDKFNIGQLITLRIGRTCEMHDNGEMETLFLCLWSIEYDRYDSE